MPALDETALRDALARLPAGVVVVSARDERGFRGLTASTFVSASLDPPLVLVCLDRFAATRDAVAAGGAFNASLLAREHEFLADRFAGRAPMVDPLWRQVPHRVADNGLPVVTGCAAWFCCRLQAIHRAGDHDIAVGLVTEAGVGEAEPLVYWQRSFWKLTQ
jgi:flavin reductase ActVB